MPGSPRRRLRAARDTVRNPAMLEAAIERGKWRQSHLLAIAAELKIPAFVRPTPEICAELAVLETRLRGGPPRAHRPEETGILADLEASMKRERDEMESAMAPTAAEISKTAEFETAHLAQMAEIEAPLRDLGTNGCANATAVAADLTQPKPTTIG